MNADADFHRHDNRQTRGYMTTNIGVFNLRRGGNVRHGDSLAAKRTFRNGHVSLKPHALSWGCSESETQVERSCKSETSTFLEPWAFVARAFPGTRPGQALARRLSARWKRENIFLHGIQSQFCLKKRVYIKIGTTLYSLFGGCSPV